MLREHRGFFLGITLAGLALRLFFLIYFPAVTDDSHVYVDLANNWLQHGIYGQTEGADIVPADTRLPGYPAFLAAIFWICGMGKIRAVLVTQVLFDLLTCLIIADLARRTIPARWAGRVAFCLAALCPFLANYSAAVLTETLEIFFTALALDCAVAAVDRMSVADNTVSTCWPLWATTGASVAASILLRPDGGILLAAIGLYLFAAMWRCPAIRGRIFWSGILVAAIALAPLVPWTIRNWRTFHQFQPLAPRYSTESEEVTPIGFNRWVATWMADYVSVEEIYWNVPGATIDAAKLPRRALDSARDATLATISNYNQAQQLTAEIDGEFDKLAWERIRAHPFRYYVALPIVRVADMWLRPRTELLPPDPRWWAFNDEPVWSTVAVGFGIINLSFVMAAAIGLILTRGELRHVWLLVGFVVLRTAFLGTIENPEPRYTLECYPVVIVLASAFFAGRRAKMC
ncbi:MAG: glycosyltransferase family 39 protein [Terriglobales bacterium]